MGIRETTFTEGEYYHIYNRGVDKRNIFLDKYDSERFLESLEIFNQTENVGSIYENNLIIDKTQGKPLVNIIAYCLNPNHFHLILEQSVDQGVKKFMHRVCTGYSKYFNHRYERSGSLFQGRFKSSHVHDNDYLLHLSAYVNINYEVHGLGRRASKTSFVEYLSPEYGHPLCHKDIILDQFSNIQEYEVFARESVLETIKSRADADDESGGFVLDAGRPSVGLV